MIIKPGILDDTKYQMLRSALGGPVALEVLVSLWGRVEVASGDHADLILDDAETIACICKYKGSPRKLKEALMAVPFGHEAGFLEKSEVSGMLKVHGWAEKNAGLMQRRLVGKLGGRPPKPEKNRNKTDRLSPGITGEEPERNRVELSRVDIKSPLPPLPNSGDEAHGILEQSEPFGEVTWEQDLTIRKCRSDVSDWSEVYRKALEIVGLKSTWPRDPALWLRRFVINWGMRKEDGAAEKPETQTVAWTGPSDLEVLPPGFKPASKKKTENDGSSEAP